MKKRRIVALFLSAALALTACSSASKKEEGEEKTVDDGKKTEASKEPKVYDASAAAQAYAQHEEISLWENTADIPYYEESYGVKPPTITPYIAEGNTNGGCVIVCPGGGYVSLALEKEGTKPALALNENNISAFVLQYRIKPYSKDAILSDIFRAVRYVRAHAEEFGIDPDKIAVMGFSAGGHLAAMSLEHSEEDDLKVLAKGKKPDETDEVSAKPNYGILCYPVISLKDELTHETTRKQFLGADHDEEEELILQYSAEEGVTKDTPPVFIWHCQNDQTVPSANSEKFAEAMEKAGVECELHIYPFGAHGLGMAEGNSNAEEWFPSCVKWLQAYGY